VIELQQMTKELLEKEDILLFIHTPFCGTCHLADSMLRMIETAHRKELFYDMNASLFPGFMQEQQIESVPCLLIKKGGVVQEKIYAFHSVPNIYTYVLEYFPEWFSQDEA